MNINEYEFRKFSSSYTRFSESLFHILSQTSLFTDIEHSFLMIPVTWPRNGVKEKETEKETKKEHWL